MGGGACVFVGDQTLRSVRLSTGIMQVSASLPVERMPRTAVRRAAQWVS